MREIIRRANELRNIIVYGRMALSLRDQHNKVEEIINKNFGLYDQLSKNADYLAMKGELDRIEIFQKYTKESLMESVEAFIR